MLTLNQPTTTIAPVVEVEQPVLAPTPFFSQCQLKYRSHSDSWVLSICGAIAGTISRVPRWLFDDDSVDRHLIEAYQIDADASLIGYTETLTDAVGRIFAYRFNLFVGIEPQPSQRDEFPDYT